ncbi:MAG: hypothetical protein LBK58_08840 [Prevotellaceae bacterium]|nr:hypothetical protein [Prevotellaceae bacterium]
MENKHSLLIPANIVSQVQGLVNQAKGLLLPYVTPLTLAERHTLPKIGGKTLSFVEKAHEYAVQNPNLCPPYLDMAAFNTDFADVHNLLMLNNATLQLHEYTDDTRHDLRQRSLSGRAHLLQFRENGHPSGHSRRQSRI